MNDDDDLFMRCGFCEACVTVFCQGIPCSACEHNRKAIERLREKVTTLEETLKDELGTVYGDPDCA